MRGALLILALVGLTACPSTETGPGGEGPEGQRRVTIPSGTFVMGTSEHHEDLAQAPSGGKPLRPQQVLLYRAASGWRHAVEQPAHGVRLSAFSIDVDEVSNARYRRFLEALAEEGDHRRCHPDEPEDKDHTPRYWGDFNPFLGEATYTAAAPFDRKTFREGDAPVVGVDWYDAYAFAAWAGGRLLTEAEWEWACAGGDPSGEARRWPWGDVWKAGVANIGGKGDPAIYPTRPARLPRGESAFGCRAMAGNAAEWVADAFAPYRKEPQVDPRVEGEAGAARVVRGGSSRSVPSQVRCAARVAREPTFRNFDLGFRIGRSL